MMVYVCGIGVLIGNKTDLESQREVDADTGEKFAVDNSLEYFECCAVSSKCMHVA